MSAAAPAALWYPAFEREFLKLAGTAFACTWEIMGGSIPGRKIYQKRVPRDTLAANLIQRRNLEYSALGLVDHCGEMRQLCRQAMRDPKRPYMPVHGQEPESPGAPRKVNGGV